MPKEDTQFKPGRSGNPLGRPKAARGLPNRIRLATREGLEMVEFHRSVMGDRTQPYADRRASADWLIHWGFGVEPFFEDAEDDEARVLPFGLTSLSPPPEDDE